ncbi:MAG: hypothetical protein M3Q47_18925 [Actinomycetota bacterium]|nr:hypothetical protein [Actinomycetota bacterium]
MGGPHQLAAMRPSAILVNTARRPLVDESAPADALVRGELWGAPGCLRGRAPGWAQCVGRPGLGGSEAD